MFKSFAKNPVFDQTSTVFVNRNCFPLQPFSIRYKNYMGATYPSPYLSPQHSLQVQAFIPYQISLSSKLRWRSFTVPHTCRFEGEVKNCGSF